MNHLQDLYPSSYGLPGGSSRWEASLARAGRPFEGEKSSGGNVRLAKGIHFHGRVTKPSWEQPAPEGHCSRARRRTPPDDAGLRRKDIEMGLYRIESMESNHRRIVRSPRKRTSLDLTRMEDGRRLNVSLRGAHRWQVGQVVSIDDDTIHLALWRPGHRP